MSIVSGKTGMVVVPTRKRGEVNAVQLGFDSVPDFQFPRQLPTINQFRKIRVPTANPRPSPKGCDVPVKFLQEGNDYPRADTEEFKGTKLEPAKPPPSKFRELIENMVAEEETFSRPVPFDYNAGIRPSVRGINFTQVVEPSGQTFRP